MNSGSRQYTRAQRTHSGDPSARGVRIGLGHGRVLLLLNCCFDTGGWTLARKSGSPIPDCAAMSLHRRRVNKMREADAEIREQLTQRDRAGDGGSSGGRAGVRADSVLRNAIVGASRGAWEARGSVVCGAAWGDVWPRGRGPRSRGARANEDGAATAEPADTGAHAPNRVQVRYVTTVALAAGFWVLMQLIFRHAGHGLQRA